MKNLRQAGEIVFLAVLMLVAIPANGGEAGGYPLIVGHRGAQGEGTACENTMKVFRWCWENGGDFAEMDVRATSDGVLVLMHDETVDRTTDGSGRLDEMSWEEVSALGRPPEIHPSYGDCRVPLLDDVLREAVGYGKGVLLHLKEEATFAAVRSAVEASGMSKEKAVLLIDANTAQEAAAEFAPSGYRLWYTTYGKPLDFSVWWAGQLVKMGYEALIFYMAADRIPTANEVAYVRGLGMRLGMSSAHGGVRAHEAMRNGVDVCLTNFPRRIHRFLGEGVAFESPYLEWLSTHQVGFVLGEGSVRPDADPDGDGLSNLLELALAMDPRVRSQVLLGRPPLYLVSEIGKIGGGSVKFSYRVDEAALTGKGAGMPIEVWAEYSERGESWKRVPVVAEGDGLYRAEVPDVSHKAGLFRLRVSDPNGPRVEEN